MSEKNNSIKNWLLDDRPREKMLEKGSKSLSDAELIAILIGSGTRQKSAVDLAKEMLQSVGGNWSDFAKLSLQDLMKFRGIGEAKAISIQTALEIGRRKNAQSPDKKPKFTGSESAYLYISSFLLDLNNEEFWVMYLNIGNQLVAKEQISKGGITQSIVDIRLIFKKALECGAVSIILSHNHPTGNLKPSEADFSITQKIKKAAELMDIKLLDHIIVGRDEYYSFADQNVL